MYHGNWYSKIVSSNCIDHCSLDTVGTPFIYNCTFTPYCKKMLLQKGPNHNLCIPIFQKALIITNLQPPEFSKGFNHNLCITYQKVPIKTSDFSKGSNHNLCITYVQPDFSKGSNHNLCITHAQLDSFQKAPIIYNLCITYVQLDFSKGSNHNLFTTTRFFQKAPIITSAVVIIHYTKATIYHSKVTSGHYRTLKGQPTHIRPLNITTATSIKLQKATPQATKTHNRSMCSSTEVHRPAIQ